MKIILGIILASLFASTAYAQEINFGSPAVQEVSITISENGDAHVVHEVQQSRDTQQVTLVSPDYTNFTILNDEGEEPEFAEVGGEKPGIVVFPTKDDVIIEYDIEGFMQQKDGLWTLDYLYLAPSAFYLPAGVELFYVNERLVQLGENEGFNCHGCQMTLQYELEPTIITKQVSWEGKTFDVEVITLAELDEITLDQPKKTLSFEITQKDKYITLIIPKELLWNPYEVSLNEKLILKQERDDTNNNVWVHIKPNETGTVSVMGVSVVPEFPLASILVLSAAMIAVVYVNKFSRR
jgi:predicted secreted protein with PEFG-CTERM motif